MSAADTIFCLLLDVRAKLAEPVRAILPTVAAGGFEERTLPYGVRFVLYAENEAELEAVEQALSSALGVLPGAADNLRLKREVRSEQWRDRWTQYLGEQELTHTMKVVAVAPSPESSAQALSSEGTLRLLQRGAFGFGEHPTTRLVARRLEQICSNRDVLDVGTGTGVLAILAALRGAKTVYGIDTDETSVEVARANAALNGVESRCRFDSRPIESVGEGLELVLANIEAPILLDLCPAIAHAVARGGQLLLSGMLTARGPELQRAYEARGLVSCGSEVEDDWLLLELRRD